MLKPTRLECEGLLWINWRGLDLALMKQSLGCGVLWKMGTSQQSTISYFQSQKYTHDSLHYLWSKVISENRLILCHGSFAYHTWPGNVEESYSFSKTTCAYFRRYYHSLWFLRSQWLGGHCLKRLDSFHGIVASLSPAAILTVNQCYP